MKNFICRLTHDCIALPKNIRLFGKEMIITKGFEGDIKLFSSDAWKKVCECLYKIDDERIKNVMLRKVLGVSDVAEVNNGIIKLNDSLRGIFPEGNVNMYLDDEIITFSLHEKKNDFFDLCLKGENNNDT